MTAPNPSSTLSIIEIIAMSDHHWLPIDPSTTLGTITSQYKSVLITLSNTTNNTIAQYSLLQLVGIYSALNTLPVASFISTYTNVLPAPLLPIKSLSNKKYIVYRDMFEYRLIPNRENTNNSSFTFNANYTPDVMITPSNGFINSLDTLKNQIIYLFNGLALLPDVYKTDKLIFNNVSKYLDLYKETHLSILDFSTLGGFNSIPLTSANTKIVSTTKDSAIAYIALPNITGAIITIINHRLHILDRTYSVINNTTIAIKLDYKSIIKELVNQNAIDSNTLLPANSNNAGFNYSSINPLNYLINNQSSIILLNTNDLQVESTVLEQTTIPAQYTLPAATNGILYLADGSIGDYTYIDVSLPDYGVAISTSTPRLLNPLIDTIPTDQLQLGLDDSNITFQSTPYPAVIKSFYAL